LVAQEGRAIKIKDFKPEQEVYGLVIKNGRITEYFLKKYTVVSVGRKYVRATPEECRFPTEFYLEEDSDNYLTENIDWGDRTKLFLTESAANEEIERYMILKWLRQETHKKLNYCTLNQLRQIRKILEENDDM
jgi:hypothetical protein